MDAAIAENLFVAISTDTGSFQYPNTTARTFEIGAELLRCGVNVGRVSQLLYESYPRRRAELLRELLGTMRFEGHGKVASFSLSLKTAAELHAKPEDNEGLIDHLRAIQGVVVAVFFEELAEGKVRVSMRSKSDAADVCAICEKFGGGGHKLAAGARVRGLLAEVEEKVLKKGDLPCRLTATPDGVLLVDKAAGMTSHDVVAIVRRTAANEKGRPLRNARSDRDRLAFAHARARNKIQDLLMSEDKEYAGTMILGVTTDTQDRAGVTLEERPVPPLDDATVRAAFEKYSGDFYQMPPMVSAIKQGGVPLYKLARQGKTVEREPRLVHVYRYSIDRDRGAGNRFQRRLQQRLLCSHLRARHRRDARLRRASQEFAAGEIGTVQRRGRDHGGRVERRRAGGGLLSRILTLPEVSRMRGA